MKTIALMLVMLLGACGGATTAPQPLFACVALENVDPPSRTDYGLWAEGDGFGVSADAGQYRCVSVTPDVPNNMRVIVTYAGFYPDTINRILLTPLRDRTIHFRVDWAGVIWPLDTLPGGCV